MTYSVRLREAFGGDLGQKGIEIAAGEGPVEGRCRALVMGLKGKQALLEFLQSSSLGLRHLLRERNFASGVVCDAIAPGRAPAEAKTDTSLVRKCCNFAVTP